MKGPQDIRREKEYNLVPDKSQRNGDEFDNDSKYLRQINALKEENEFLRGLSNRLHGELKEYQIRFPQLLVDNNNNRENRETPNGDISNLENTDLAPWISSSKYMSPLLVAYDSRIKELNEEIKIYKENALEIKKETNILIKRNCDLENELETKIISLYKKLKIKNKNINNNNGNNDNDIMDEYDFNEYEQRINILSQQNKLLRESEIRWKNEKENYLLIINENKKNIDLLHKELNKINSINNDFEEISKNLNYENNQLKDINNELKNNVIKKLNEKIEFLEERIKIEISEHNSLKKRFIEYENEYNSLNNIHSKLSGKYRMLQSENTNLMNKVDVFNDEIIEYKNALSANKKKLSSMTESLGTIENVLKIYKNKEIEYMKQINDLKTNHELFVNIEKDKLINENNLYLKQINKLKMTNKNVLDEIQKENKMMIHKLNEKYIQKEQILNDTINDLMKKNVILNEEKNEFENKCISANNDMGDIKKIYFEKFEKLKTTENSLNCKIKELNLEKERCSDLAKRKETDLIQQQNLWKSEREIYDETISKLNKNDDRKNLQLIQNEENILNLKELNEKLNDKLKIEKTRNIKHSEGLNNKLSKNENIFNSMIEDYKKEIINLEDLYNSSQIKTKDIINKHESLSTKWKEENRKTFENFTNIINELKKENKSLITINIKLETKMQNIINNELKNTLSINNNIKKKLENHEKSQLSLNETMNNLKSMNEKYKKKEMVLLNENKNLRNELNTLQITMQRVQRNKIFNDKINSH